MNSALIEIGDPDINEERVIQQLQFTFSEQFIENIKKRLQKSHIVINNIARVITLSSDEFSEKLIYNCLTKILQYWIKDYNFHEQEKVFNRFPHFYTIIDDLKIHYIHVKPTNLDKKPVYPLLLLHGWPSSILEFYNVIPFLIDTSNDFMFEVIIPSLPGFGGSDCPSNENLNCDFIAGLLVKLMKVLGHKQFYVHCDDWCVFVVHAMSLKYSANLLAIHYALCQPYKDYISLSFYITRRLQDISRDSNKELYTLRTVCNSPTSFCEHTIGISAIDSPVILLTYLFEKFIRDSSYNDTIDIIESNDCKKSISICQFLDNVMMYWATNSIIKTLKAYSGYFTFDKFDKFKAIFQSNTYVRYNTFVGVTLFLFDSHIYRTSMKPEENIFVNSYYHSSNYRFPAMESPMILAESIFINFKQFLARNVAK